MPGISNTIPESIEIACNECSHKMRVYTYGQARYIGCQSCSSFYQYNNQQLKRIQKWDKTPSPHLKLGQKAHYRHGLFILTGIAAKAIPEYKVSWIEYLFFNPVHGYFSLSENNGHWMLMEVIRDYPREIPRLATNVVYDKKIYTLINRDNVITEYAIGEFPSKVHASIKADEFIRPPFMLAREIQSDCCEWYFGKYHTPEEVLALIKGDVKLPKPVGVGAAQPPVANLGSTDVKGIAGLFTVLIVLLGISLNNINSKQLLLSKGFIIPPKAISNVTNNNSDIWQKIDSIEKSMNPDIDKINSMTADQNQLIVTEPFEVKGILPVNIESYFDADVYNDWIYAEGYLVNEQTGETTVFWNDVEYYTGTDDEGQWKEGSQESSKTISSIKPGRYHLNLKVINETTKPKKLNVKLMSGKTIFSNLFVCLILFLALPVFILLKRHNFERRRWMNSDYSPYSSD